jgi:arsenate reductase
MKKTALFICVHNSARSQMAEAFVNQLCSDNLEAHSAGLLPGNLNPVVVEAMREIGFDISGNKTKSVEDVLKSGQSFAYAVTVCSEAEAEACPIFPSATTQLHWSFPDPSKLAGSREEKLRRTGDVRDSISAKIEEWCTSACQPRH